MARLTYRRIIPWGFGFGCGCGHGGVRASITKVENEGKFTLYPKSLEIKSVTLHGDELPVDGTTFEVPEDLPTGNHEVTVNTDCGCFKFELINQCETPRFQGKHTTTNPERGEIMTECCSDSTSE